MGNEAQNSASVTGESPRPALESTATEPVATPLDVEAEQIRLRVFGRYAHLSSWPSRVDAALSDLAYLLTLVSIARQQGIDSALDVITYDKITPFLMKDEVDDFTVSAVINRARKLVRALTPSED